MALVAWTSEQLWQVYIERIMRRPCCWRFKLSTSGRLQRSGLAGRLGAGSCDDDVKTCLLSLTGGRRCVDQSGFYSAQLKCSSLHVLCPRSGGDMWWWRVVLRSGAMQAMVSRARQSSFPFTAPREPRARTGLRSCSMSHFTHYNQHARIPYGLHEHPDTTPRPLLNASHLRASQLSLDASSLNDVTKTPSPSSLW